ncbi:DUF7009 family protein [Pontibacter rugosus]|uniref:DUF7009 family protein n=1 Tax=Pontibacter rugosus TaxID=1745966 RepID=A0ABW3SLM4_9BACT
MKIRLKENNIKLSLTQQELEQFNHDGKVVTTSQLGPSLVQTLSYSLMKDEDADEVSATFVANHIKVFVPVEVAQKWLETDQKSLEGQMPLDEGESLYILVEKDLQ